MLPSLPTRADDETKKITAKVERFVKKYNKEAGDARARLRQARNRGSGQTEAREIAALKQLENEPAPRFAPDTAPGGGGSPPPPPQQQQLPTAAPGALLAFAMGSHARLGQASPMRVLDPDTLRAIAAAFRGKEPPPPSEMVRQARLAP